MQRKIKVKNRGMYRKRRDEYRAKEQKSIKKNREIQRKIQRKIKENNRER